MRSNKLVLGVVFGLLVLGLGTQSFTDAFAALDSKGKEFILTFLPQISTGKVQLHLTSDSPTTATVNYPVNSPTFTTTVNVNPGTITVVDLPLQAWTSWNRGTVQNNAVLVESPQEITVYTTNIAPATSDAALAIPTDATSFKYIIQTWDGPREKSFAVAGISDNTKVTITPTNSLSGGFPSGVPFEITLNRGQGFLGASGFDLSGTIITADKPIAVTNGDFCTNIIRGACDHIYEIGLPVQGWGKTALVGDIADRPRGSIYQVIASEENTTVSLDGSVVATLDEGEIYKTGETPGNHVITADKPISVVQFMTGFFTTGDPAMANIIPPEQFLNKYTFSTVGGGQFDRHFLAITVATNEINSIRLDGNPINSNIFSPIGTTGYSYGLIDFLSEGTHTTSSPSGHGILVGGFTSYDSYFYPGGAAFEFINPQPEDDRDGDGIPDLQDECPDEFAQTANGNVMALNVTLKQEA
jgi:hypothetical protein